MGRLLSAWAFVQRNKWVKYVAAFFLFALIIGVLDENSLWVRFQRQAEIAGLRKEIKKYQAEYEAECSQLDALQSDISAVERYARERYLMKRPDEDLFVFVEPNDYQVTEVMTPRRRPTRAPQSRQTATGSDSISTEADTTAAVTAAAATAGH